MVKYVRELIVKAVRMLVAGLPRAAVERIWHIQEDSQGQSAHHTRKISHGIRNSVTSACTRVHDKYSGSIKIKTQLDHNSHF
jgi:hypothetical protein